MSGKAHMSLGSDASVMNVSNEMRPPVTRSVESRKAMIGSIVHSLGFGELEIIEYGAIVYSAQGVIEEILNFSSQPEAKKKLVDQLSLDSILDYSGKLLVPGFVDAHCHAPQYTFTGTGMDLPLLQWLEKYTFPSEAKFQDPTFAKMAYEKSVKRHLKHGTTTASYFGTLHLEASKILVDVIDAVGQRAFVGKVSMDRNAPDFYVEDTQQGLREAEEFVQFVLSRSPTGRRFLQHLTHTPNCTTMDESDDVHFPCLLDDVEVLGKRALQLEEQEELRHNKRPRAFTDLSCSDITSANYQFTFVPSTASASPPVLTHTGPSRSSSGGLASSNTMSLAATSMEVSDRSSPLGSARVYQSLLNRIDTPRVLPVITPRFVPTCSALLMTGLSELALKYGLPIQSHMSESVGEIQWVQDLHPECLGLYVDVYRRYGLIGRPLTSYMAHCVHSDHHEMVTMRRCNTGAVHCASSNFMLSSGIMDVRHFMEEGVKVAVGTDVAGGYSPSMLDALRQTIIASRAKGFQLQCYAPPNDRANAATTASSKNAKQKQDDEDQLSENDEEHGLKLTSSSESSVSSSSAPARASAPAATGSGSNSNAIYRALSYSEAFHLCTMGGAEVLGMEAVLGNFLPGKKMDCLVVDVDAADSPIDTFGSESTSELFQKFLFLGDDRNLAAIYVDGVRVL